MIHAVARGGAGGRPGHRLDGDSVHLLHALFRGRVARGHPYRPQARAHRRHQRIRALHPRQPRPDMVRASWVAILSGRHGSCAACASVWALGTCIGLELDAWYLFDKKALDKMQAAWFGLETSVDATEYLVNSCLNSDRVM